MKNETVEVELILDHEQLPDESSDPADDPSYQAFLVDCAKHCHCCECCQQVPCAGVTAGGMCDGMLCYSERMHDDDDDDQGDWYDEDDWT